MLASRRTKGGIFAAATIAVAALVASALPAQAETGVTSSTIKLGITVPLTGAAAPGYNKIPGAMNGVLNGTRPSYLEPGWNLGGT